ncbi:multicopper oxidase family protein [Hamadaea tsunoensis]|uniref:multicopper oxidase family protein n=1 Tax=Hamadaea tsunoensis TaxID=53368 RepID=UPI000406BA4A|nr:multicopper oxidase domain-containing protein [Hamadaea tsunoensis]
MRRRTFFTLAAVPALLTACGPGDLSGGPEPQAKLSFRNRLRIPPLAPSTVDKDGVRRFELTMQRGRTELLPGKPTDTYGFNGSYLGPTVRARRGETVRMVVRNELGEQSTVHWHGMRLPARMDGGPHLPIAPGATWSPQWTITQPAATSWYHPHPHGATAMHVYRGLAGLFLLDEPGGPTLPSAYGVDDVPLILQDKNLAADGSLAGDPLKGTFGILGNTVLVNGTYDPYLAVESRRVRLRILNGSNARMYDIRFADRRRFHVIANDAGLLNAPVEVDQVSLSPGERAEIVAEFAPGEQVVLRSIGGSADIDAGDLDLLKIVAAKQLKASPPLPDRLADRHIDVPAGAKVRRFKLNGHDSINGQEMDMTRIDEVVAAGAREIWEIVNNVYSHNFHIHEVAFRVLDVDGAPPPAYATGPKDTVFVPGKSTVRLAVEFGQDTDPNWPYMYHCHILRHEDSGMMGQFVVVPPGTESVVPRVLGAHAGHSM